MEVDLISPTVADHAIEIKDRSTESIPSIESVETRRPAPEDEPSKYKDVKQEEAETTISSAQPSSNHQGALIFTRQIFLARQLGDLIIAQVHEKRCLADMLIGLLAMPVVTMAIMATSGFLGNATALTLRGYRTKEDLKFMNDQCGPWEIFAAVCIRSLLVPWLRILFAFYR